MTDGGIGGYYKSLRQLKQPVQDARFDFRGGRNTAITADLLNPNELVNCTNCRLDINYGGVSTRNGSQRIHTTALGVPSSVMAVTQWDGPNGKQVVAIAQDGKLYFRDGFTFATAFTAITPGTLFSGGQSFFVPFRDSSSGAPLKLFISNNSGLYSWDGTATLTRLTGTLNAPGAALLAAYHTRLFARDSNFLKTIYWSTIGLPADWTTGAANQGGSALVDVLNGESILALEVIGSSLLIGTRNSISRFTGYSSADIVIAQDTEGISSEVGPLNGYGITRFENTAAMITERGPYIAQETGVQPIGEQIYPDFQANTPLSNVILVYHKGQKELWYFVPNGINGAITKAFVYSVRLQAWQGPFGYPFTIASASPYYDANGIGNVIVGCTDGFIRIIDAPNLVKDDVLQDGTGGSSFTTAPFIELPIIHFGAPGITKAIRRILIQAIIPNGSSIQALTSFDGESFTSNTLTSNGTSNASNYRLDLLEDQGKRLRLQLVMNPGGGAVTLLGYTLLGFMMNRI